eukprot:4687447-Pleurochrysis_carterae.AAC.1
MAKPPCKVYVAPRYPRANQEYGVVKKSYGTWTNCPRTCFDHWRASLVAFSAEVGWREACTRSP